MTRIAAVVLALMVAACGGGGGQQAAQTPTAAPPAAAAAAAFRSPKAGAKVTSPVPVRMTASAVKIEKSGKVRPGGGHFHVMIDTQCVATVR